MDFSFGKNKGKAVAWVLLAKPDYISWMAKEKMNEKPEYIFALQLIKTLDAKPVTTSCSGRCGKTPTRLSLYQGLLSGSYWFCDDCDIYGQGARRGTLSTINTYNGALSSTRDKERVVQEYTNAKGVPKIKTKASLKKYFEY